MPCIEVSDTLPVGLKAWDQYQVYNALDASITAELVDPMLEFCSENQLRTYDHKMRLQQLCLEMSAKGFPINRIRSMDLVSDLEKEAARALHCLHAMCDAVYAPRLNPNSSKAVPEFFYDHLQLPVIWKYDHKTKQRKRSADRDTLERLASMYPVAIPFVNAILAYREPTKLASVFKKGLEPSGVLRCNFSPSGTETGRLSSQSNVYGRGTNAQNLNDRVRQVIEAPPGYCLVYLDLKTAESIAVGFLSGDTRYIQACMGGDLHTAAAELVWPNLGWQQGDLSYNRKLADHIFYRDMSYRDMSKRGGHASNYYGQPPTIAKHLKIESRIVASFQHNYFTAFPGIQAWQLDTIARVQRDGKLVTPLGYERRFWGRPSDSATHREAIAFVPQSLVAQVMNEGLMQCQRWLLRNLRHDLPSKLGWGLAYERAGLLAQVHDAGLFLLPSSEADAIITELLQQIVFPVDFGPLGVMRIPADAQIGRRWSKKPKKDKKGLMDGLQDWTPGLAAQLGY